MSQDKVSLKLVNKRGGNSQQLSTGKYDASKLGANLVPTHLEVVTDGASTQGLATAAYHSLLAMEAARKMRRTRQKLRTGQTVCHHLKMMLSEPLAIDARRRDIRQSDQTAESGGGDSGQNSAQFRLGF